MRPRKPRPPCVICGKDAKRVNAKTCSSECHSKLISVSMVEKYRKGEIKLRTGNVGVKGHVYKGIYLRSSWELEFAKYLDSQDIKWEYESKRFDLGDSTYVPDFYLPNMNAHIEIKGWMTEKFMKKMEKMSILYPSSNLLVINRPPPYNWVF